MFSRDDTLLPLHHSHGYTAALPLISSKRHHVACIKILLCLIDALFIQGVDLALPSIVRHCTFTVPNNATN